MDWTKLADADALDRTMASLKERGIESFIAENREDAKRLVLEMVPKGAEVMDNMSITLRDIGIAKEMEESGNYISLRLMIKAEEDKEKREKLRKSLMAPDYALGSANAITEAGEIVFASASGSQLPSYAYGAKHVILVVGTQKIVKDLDHAMRRIKERALPLESERVRESYGMKGSSINRTLILEREYMPDRTKVIFIKESLGF